MDASNLVYLASFYLVFLLSTTLHEASHAWAALRGGDPTAYLGGQASLDPRPHIRREPFGMVLLPLISLVLMGWPFGYASAPFDPRWAARFPHRAARMALAGPLANLALMILAAVLIRVGTHSGIFVAPDAVGFAHLTESAGGGPMVTVALLLSLTLSMNLLLFLFNLLPVPPLDGSAAVGLLFDENTARRVQNFLRQPMFAMVGLLLAWRVFGSLFGPVFVFVVNLLYPGTSYG